MKAQDAALAALRKIGVVARDEPAEPHDVTEAVVALGAMLRSWSNRRIAVFQTAEQSVALTMATGYALSPVPMRIHGIRLRRNDVDLPMVEMTRQEYDDLPLKTATGTPTTWYADRQRDAMTVHVWPAPAVGGATLRITYERGFGDISLRDDVPVLPEWDEAVIYNLADRLSDDYERQNEKVTARAEALLADALAADREGSVFFAGPCA